MKILHLNEHGDLRGGAEGYLADVARYLGREGHASVLVYRRQGMQGGLAVEPGYHITYPDYPGDVNRACWLQAPAERTKIYALPESVV